MRLCVYIVYTIYIDQKFNEDSTLDGSFLKMSSNIL